jgi:glyoxylase-like metal-dependent hydrolase (beta-lactamase superfamily II)
VAIDAGMDSEGRDFLDAVKTLNRPAADVRAVLHTHWHNDHAAGAAALREKLGARIYYAVADAPFMTQQNVEFAPGFLTGCPRKASCLAEGLAGRSAAARRCCVASC